MAPGDESTDVAAKWQAFCRELAELPSLPGVAGAAGFEHLFDQTALWLAWETLHADPSRPWFHRHNDMVSQWGGPNYDNVYIHARIDPTRRYRIRGRMHGCDNLLLAIRAGFMHEPVWGTLNQLTASDLGIGRYDEFELTFGPADAEPPEPPEPPSDKTSPASQKMITLPEGAMMISIREFYIDWQPEEPATIVIECLDPEPAPSPIPSPAELSDRLDATVAQMRHSISYWNDYLANNRADRTDNSFAKTTVDVEGKGLAQARYEFCFWNLEPDQALVVTCEEPTAEYWSANLYRMNTFEPVQWFEALTSRNHRQATVDPDGHVRFVVSATDTGHPNWLDTTGLVEGLCTVRWFWPTDDRRPELSTEVVPLTEITPASPVTATARAAELQARQDHLRWRFRS